MTRRSKPRVRVVVYLDPIELEQLEAIREHRHGHASRSAVVREAVVWLLGKEAAWLLRAQAVKQRREEQAAAAQSRLERPREEREKMERDELVDQAVEHVRATRRDLS